jgi:iron complex transport system substrate-binding protein
MTAILFLWTIVISCEVKKSESPLQSHTLSQTTIRYAEGFSVQYQGNNKLVEVKQPFQGAASGQKYLLVPRGEIASKPESDVNIIHVPVRSIVCTSTTHIPLLDYLDEGEKLIGFPSTDYICSPNIRKRIDEGHVTDLGVDQGINLERLALLQPEMVMGYTMSSDYGQFEKIEELNIPVVLNSEYLEKHPLGRAEWIKFVALFFDKEREADSIFSMIEKSYTETKRLADSAPSKPTILSGIVYGDTWFLPGGQNYAARIFKDAGCTYLWEENPSHGFLEISFESVYEKAHAADLWIGVGNYSTLNDIEKSDHRYTLFSPFNRKEVYNYDKRKGAKGGNEFLELGYLRPDLILKDLVYIAHPDLLPLHELYFYRRLE